MKLIMLLSMLNCMGLAAGQRRQFLKDVIDKKKVLQNMKVSVQVLTERDSLK